ncbi:acyl carrier protein [Streptomyces hypolithicus]
MAKSAPVMSEGEILGWLTERLGAHVSLPVAEINPVVPYAEYGLDSVAALALFGDVEEKFNLALDPAVAWEYPTLAQMTAYLAAERSSLASLA